MKKGGAAEVEAAEAEAAEAEAADVEAAEGRRGGECSGLIASRYGLICVN